MPSLTCLGAPLQFMSAAADYVDGADRMPVGPGVVEGALAPALAAHDHFTRSLTSLRAHGLSLQHALVLHRIFTTGAITHLLRSGVVSEDECSQWDRAVQAVWEAELGRTLSPDQSAQLFLPIKLGGCGLQSATKRRLAAFLGSWELCFAGVCAALGSPAAAAFRASCPRAAAAISAAAGAVESPAYRFDWAQLFGTPRQKRQRALSVDAAAAQLRNLLAIVPADDQVDIRSAGGSGAGAFLLPPELPDHKMSDDYLAAAIRRRLRLTRAACACVPGSPSHCKHRTKEGAICGEPLDARDFHAATCNVGGGVDFGHNALRDWLAGWIEEVTGRRAPTEEYVTAWDRPKVPAETDPETGLPKIEHARLDVSFIDGTGRRAYVDVAVTSAGTTRAAERAKRAATDGAAADDMVRTKRSRYPPHKNPGCSMVPFVVEALGRLSPDAEDLLRALAPVDKQTRSVVLRRAKQSLSVVIQARLADLLLSAERSRGAAAPAAA